jgi:hypothetical protein
LFIEIRNAVIESMANCLLKSLFQLLQSPIEEALFRISLLTCKLGTCTIIGGPQTQRVQKLVERIEEASTSRLSASLSQLLAVCLELRDLSGIFRSESSNITILL